MKIAVVGNSHVVSLQEALGLVPILVKDFDITFYAAPARDAHKIKVEHGKIVPISDRTKKFYQTTSRGQSFVKLDDYDCIWLYGLSEQLDKIGAWYQRVYKQNFFSKTVKEISYVDRYNVGFKLAGSIENQAVYVSPRPVPSHRDIVETQCDLSLDGMAPVMEFMKKKAQEASARFVAQPTESLMPGGGFVTDPKYSEGSNSLSKGGSQAASKVASKRQDYLHMNADFGALMWRELFDELFAGQKLL